MRLGLLLWGIALAFAVYGLISVLRYRLVLGTLLIVAGLGLGLYSSTKLGS